MIINKVELQNKSLGEKTALDLNKSSSLGKGKYEQREFLELFFQNEWCFWKRKGFIFLGIH